MKKNEVEVVASDSGRLSRDHTLWDVLRVGLLLTPDSHFL